MNERWRRLPGRAWHRARTALAGFARSPRGRRASALFLVALLCETAYVFYLSAGTFGRWPHYQSYCDIYAEGFRAGHLHLRELPDETLRTAVNPLDPANFSHWMWDASYYRGKFYMYWGPAPALLLAAVKSVFSVRGVVGDEFLAFAFASGRLAFGLFLIELLAHRVYAGVPSWLVLVTALVFGLASPMPFTMSRGAIYEVTILAGQCFWLGASYFALSAVLNPSRSALFLLVASFVGGLAVASRASVLPSVLAVLALAFFAVRALPRRPRLLAPALAASLPLLFTGLLLVAYNHARFDDWTETGMNHQMSFRHFAYDPAYTVANLYSYLLRKVALSCQFPFIRAHWAVGTEFLPAWLKLPAGYWLNEPVAGALWVCPWLLLAVFAVLGLRRRASESEPVRIPRLFAVVAFTLASLLGLVGALGMWMATMRFQLDVQSAGLLLATVGAFALWNRLGARPRWLRWLSATGLSGLAATSIVAAMLLGFQGYYEHFYYNNPKLLDALRPKLTLCGARPPAF